MQESGESRDYALLTGVSQSPPLLLLLCSKTLIWFEPSQPLLGTIQPVKLQAGTLILKPKEKGWFNFYSYLVEGLWGVEAGLLLSEW